MLKYEEEEEEDEEDKEEGANKLVPMTVAHKMQINIEIIMMLVDLDLFSKKDGSLTIQPVIVSKNTINPIEVMAGMLSESNVFLAVGVSTSGCVINTIKYNSNIMANIMVMISDVLLIVPAGPRIQ
jgi:hypothetical protein